MVAPGATVFRTTGAVRMPRIRTARAEGLARANSRYLLGCIIALGYPRASVSLDFLAFEEVCRALITCLEARRLKAERRYQVGPILANSVFTGRLVQLALEMRTITWYIAQRGPEKCGLDRIPSAPLVEVDFARRSSSRFQPSAWVGSSGGVCARQANGSQD
jgi:hypothetical protein